MHVDPPGGNDTAQTPPQRLLPPQFTLERRQLNEMGVVGVGRECITLKSLYVRLMKEKESLLGEPKNGQVPAFIVVRPPACDAREKMDLKQGGRAIWNRIRARCKARMDRGAITEVVWVHSHVDDPDRVHSTANTMAKAAAGAR